MKKITPFFLLILSIFAFTTQAQKRTVEVSSFSELAFGISGKLYLRQGPQSVEIDCSDELFDKIEFRVSNNKLIIESKNNWGWSGIGQSNIVIYVTMENIEGLSVSGSGQLIGEQKLETEDLKLRISGSGTISLSTSAKNITTEISGSGKVMLEGNANNLKTRISGSGSVKGEELIVNTVDASISGSGNVYVTVNEEIKANISGSGNVYYQGEPKRRDANSSGSGRIRKLND